MVRDPRDGAGGNVKGLRVSRVRALNPLVKMIISLARVG